MWFGERIEIVIEPALLAADKVESPSRQLIAFFRRRHLGYLQRFEYSVRIAKAPTTSCNREIKRTRPDTGDMHQS